MYILSVFVFFMTEVELMLKTQKPQSMPCLMLVRCNRNDKTAVETPYFDSRSNSLSLESLKRRNKSLMSILAFLNRSNGFYSPNYIPHLKKEYCANCHVYP